MTGMHKRSCVASNQLFGVPWGQPLSFLVKGASTRHHVVSWCFCGSKYQLDANRLLDLSPYSPKATLLDDFRYLQELAKLSEYQHEGASS